MSDDRKNTRELVVVLTEKFCGYTERSQDWRANTDRRFNEMREEKLDLEKRVHCVEKKVWGISTLVSAVISGIGIFFNKH